MVRAPRPPAPRARSAVTHLAASPRSLRHRPADRPSTPTPTRPAEVGGRSGRACAAALGSGGRCDLQRGLAGEGASAAGCGPPLATAGDRSPQPRLSSSRARPPPARTHQPGAPGPDQLAVAPVLRDGAVAGDSGGTTRDGQRRGRARSGGAGVQTNAGRLAPSPPPVACRLPRGCAQRRPGLPGSPQRCDGVSAARAPGEGPSALIRQGRALAPDSCLPEPGPRGQAPGQGVLWGTEPALGDGVLQPSPGGDRPSPGGDRA